MVKASNIIETEYTDQNHYGQTLTSPTFYNLRTASKVSKLRFSISFGELWVHNEVQNQFSDRFGELWVHNKGHYHFPQISCRS